MLLKVRSQPAFFPPGWRKREGLTCDLEFEMLHDDEVIPKYAADIVIGRVQGQEPSLEI